MGWGGPGNPVPSLMVRGGGKGSQVIRLVGGYADSGNLQELTLTSYIYSGLEQLYKQVESQISARRGQAHSRLPHM